MGINYVKFGSKGYNVRKRNIRDPDTEGKTVGIRIQRGKY